MKKNNLKFNKKNNFKSKFLIEGIDEEELTQFLQHQYSNASIKQLNENIQQLFIEDKILIEYKFSNKKDGEIEGIYLNDTKNNIEKLILEMKESLLTINTKVHRVVLFYPLKIEGFYKFQDIFQIIQVPENHPQPPFALAKFPFILEFKYNNTPNIWISLERKQKRQKELIYILNLLLDYAISEEDIGEHFSWVYTEDINNESQYLQKGYNLSIEYTGKFSETKDLINLSPTPKIESNLTQNCNFKNAFHFLEKLTIPSYFEGKMQKFINLDSYNKKKFTTACYWFTTSNYISKYSKSSGYLALSNAIEVLLDKPNSENCEKCGKPKGDGPTKLFKNFIEEHLQINDKKLLNELYNFRSNITHGNDEKELLYGDLYKNHVFHPKYYRDDKIFDELKKIVKLVLCRWLEYNND